MRVIPVLDGLLIFHDLAGHDLRFVLKLVDARIRGQMGVSAMLGGIGEDLLLVNREVQLVP